MDNSAVEESKSDHKNRKLCLREKITMTEVEGNSIMEHKLPEQEWVAVDRQLKLVKSRLKINAAVKECPKLIEQKENYIPLKSSSSIKPLTESELSSVPREQISSSASNYSIK